MKVNGFQLREAIKRWTLQRDTIAAQWTESLWRFQDEDKPGPEKLMAQFETADVRLARLEEIQERYNLRQNFVLDGTEFTLAMGVKLIGGAGRREKMWRQAAGGANTPDRWGNRDARPERDPDKTYAVRSMPPAECLGMSLTAARWASQLRNAISLANTRDIDIEEIGLSIEEAERLLQ